MRVFKKIKDFLKTEGFNIDFFIGIYLIIVAITKSNESELVSLIYLIGAALFILTSEIKNKLDKISNVTNVTNISTNEEKIKQEQ